jgi:hypothetical protein
VKDNYMTRIVLALAFLVSVPAFSDDDPLDPAQIQNAYPTMIKRAEKRDRSDNVICGIVVRCLGADEKECHLQYKSEIDNGFYSVVYASHTSQVNHGSNGSITVKGKFANDVRIPAPGVPAPTMTYVWEIDGQLNYDENKKVFNFTQKQQANTVTASYASQTQGEDPFYLNDVHPCSGMIQISP